MRPQVQSTSGAGTKTGPMLMDQYLTPFQATVTALVTGACRYTVEFSNDDPFATGYPTDYGTDANWFVCPDLTLVNQTVSRSSAAFAGQPVRAIRAIQTEGAGSVQLTVNQAG